MFKRITALLAAAVTLLCVTVYAKKAQAASAPFETCASAMMLMEAQTNTVLTCQNEDRKFPMASTTKIMTAIVTLENASLSDIVVVDEIAEGVEGSSMYLVAGERISVEDLLYGLMLASGNDAAVALAAAIGGSVEGFVNMMNERAEEMGLTSTHFVTPNGLHNDEHYTTAKELAIIASYAYKNEDLRRIVATKYHTTTTGEVVRTLKNKNTLLWNYEGAIGFKTGYTSTAGRCLVFGAERDGMTVIGVLLNCRPMFDIAARLMDYAFSEYTMCCVISGGTVAAHVYVENGTKSILEVIVKNDIMVTLPKGAEREFSIDLVLDESISAPVTANSVLGTINVYCDDELVASEPLAAAYSVDTRGFDYWWQMLIKSMAG